MTDQIPEIYAKNQGKHHHLAEYGANYSLLSAIDESYVREAIDSTLMELREALHRHGRLSSRNEALDELSKLLFAHIMMDGGISKSSVLGASRRTSEASQLLASFVRDAFQKHLPKSLCHEMDINDFEIKLKSQEDVLVLEIIEIFEQLAQESMAQGITSFRGVDLLNDVFGTFLADSFANEKQLGQYLTPTEVVKFMVRLAIEDMTEDEFHRLCNPKHCEEFGLILDPSCGVGSFLTEMLRTLCAEASRRHGVDSLQVWIDCMVSKVMVGIDKSERMIRLALTNMATFGLPAAQLHLANSLSRFGPDANFTKSLEGRVKLILTNPPFGAEFRGNDLLEYRIANAESGRLLQKVNSELLFVERYVDWLAPGGQFLAIVPDSILTNKGVYENLRKQLSEQVEIRSVISLPVVTFGAAGTNTKTSILHVRKSQAANSRSKTFFAICYDIGYSIRTKNAQRTKTNNGNNKGDLPKILQTLTSPNPNSEYSRVVANVEHSARWDANYYVSLPLEVEYRINNPSSEDVFLANVARLANDRTDPRRWETGTFHYIEISDIDSDTCMVRTQIVPCNEAPSRARKLVRAGDVLFSTVRPERRTVGVVQADQDGSVCSTGLAVLRPQGIPSLVLAYLLRTDLAINQVLRNTLGIAYPAIDEKCLPGILLPIQKQRLESLRSQADTLLDLEKQIDIARKALNNAVMKAIQSWEKLDDVSE